MSFRIGARRISPSCRLWRSARATHVGRSNTIFLGLFSWSYLVLLTPRSPPTPWRAPASAGRYVLPILVKNRAGVPRITPERGKPFVSYNCVCSRKHNSGAFWARFRRRSSADPRERECRRSLYRARSRALFAVRCCTIRPCHTPLHTVIMFSHACAALHHSTTAFPLRSVHEPARVDTHRGTRAAPVHN